MTSRTSPGQQGPGNDHPGSQDPGHQDPGHQDPGNEDPWAAFGYLVAGVGLYGVLGFVLGRWLHADYLVPIGIVVGAMFGMFMVFARYRYRAEDPTPVQSDPSGHIDPIRQNDPQQNPHTTEER